MKLTILRKPILRIGKANLRMKVHSEIETNTKLHSENTKDTEVHSQNRVILRMTPAPTIILRTETAPKPTKTRSDKETVN